MTEPSEQACQRPLSGAVVATLPSGLIPARGRLEGNAALLEAIDPERYAAELFAASHGIAPRWQGPSWFFVSFVVNLLQPTL